MGKTFWTGNLHQRQNVAVIVARCQIIAGRWQNVAMRLILIRHGQTASNLGRHLDTAVPGAPLTELGIEQAQALAQTLRGERIDAIYCSTFLRTQQTALPLADERGLEMRIRSGIREISAGILEMANDEESIRTYLDVVMGWADGEKQGKIPGTDRTGAAILGDFDEVVNEILDSGVESAAVFSHGAIMRAWAGSRAVNLAPGFAGRTTLSNTGVVLLDFVGGQWIVTQWQEQALDTYAGESRDTRGASEQIRMVE